MADTTLKINGQDNASTAINQVKGALDGLVKLLGADQLLGALKAASAEYAAAEQGQIKWETAVKNGASAIGLNKQQLEE